MSADGVGERFQIRAAHVGRFEDRIGEDAAQRHAGEEAADQLHQDEQDRPAQLDLLGDEPLRRLVLLKLEGHTNTESAALLGRTRVTVQRMLKLIQQTWQLELTR